MCEYELNTVTYGTVAAPFLALRVLKQLAIDEGERYPLAADVLSSSTYVDDIVTGAATIESAVKLRSQLINLLHAGGFSVKKFTSNSPMFLKDISDTDRKTLVPLFLNDSSVKILGLQWIPDSDTFSYHIQIDEKSLTKPSILSNIARIFDPLGWLSPVVVYSKIIM